MLQFIEKTGRFEAGRGVRGRGDWVLLADLRVDPMIIEWMRDGERTLEAAYEALPRADWLVEIAARAGVARPIVMQAVSDCLAEIGKNPRDVALCEGTRRATWAWRSRQAPLGPMLAAFAAALDADIQEQERAGAARLAEDEDAEGDLLAADLQAALVAMTKRTAARSCASPEPTDWLAVEEAWERANLRYAGIARRRISLEELLAVTKGLQTVRLP